MLFAIAAAANTLNVPTTFTPAGKIERPAQDRIKTDRRDAERPVRLLMVDGPHAVRVPTREEEPLTDLCARYELEMDPESVPALIERFGCASPGSRSCADATKPRGTGASKAGANRT